MKPNKEIIYDFIKLHTSQNGGISTQYIAQVLNMQRTNVSSVLGRLVDEGKVDKVNGRPVLYYAKDYDGVASESCFQAMIGYDGSLKRAVQLAKAAVLYPQKSLNTMIVGAKGTGKSFLVKQIYQFAVQSETIPSTAQLIKFNCKDYTENEWNAIQDLFGSQGDNGYLHTQNHNILFIDNIQYLSKKLQRQILNNLEEAEPMVIVSCDNKSRMNTEDYTSDFPIIIELPLLEERSFTERLELIQNFFSQEAAKMKRTLIIKEELLRCLLLYDCEANLKQLKADIKIGCANAYAREYKSKEELQLFMSDFEHYVRLGFLKYKTYRDEVEKIIPSNYDYTFNETSLHMRAIDKEKTSKGTIYEEINKKAYLEQSITEEASSKTYMDKKPVILLAFYGEDVANTVMKAVFHMTHLDNIYALELFSDHNDKETYDTLKNQIVSINRGKGVIVVYDSCSLNEMLPAIQEELNVHIRQLPLPVVTTGIELSKIAAVEDSVDFIYQSVTSSLNLREQKLTNIIVALCSTGKGSAEELKRYIEQYGKLVDTKVIALANTDTSAVKEQLTQLLKEGSILCIVGTYDPQLFSIPFLSISDIFKTPKEKLPKLLEQKHSNGEQVDYDAMLSYLSEQLEHVEIDILNKYLPDLLEQISESICELSRDTLVGLFIHISCCIDRLAGNLSTPANRQKAKIITEYHSQFRKLLRAVKPIEKALNIIFNDDEIANILTIIYQL